MNVFVGIEIIKKFILCFIPLFVAVDVIGGLPIFINLTQGVQGPKLKKILIQSVLTALGVGLAFLVLGSTILSILGITIPDFMVAGGILLFLLSIGELLNFSNKKSSISADDTTGPVPLGIPLIVGPAVLATGILLSKQYGFLMTGVALSLNILIAGVVFWFSHHIGRFLGKVGAKVFSKLSSLLLAAYGVMLIRSGIMQFF